MFTKSPVDIDSLFISVRAGSLKPWVVECQSRCRLIREGADGRQEESTKSRRRSPLFYRADRNRWVGRISVNGKPRTVSARTKTEARYKLDQLRRAADDGLPVITRDRTIAELLELWRTKALPNRDLSPARIASHDWAIRILTHELGAIKLQALTVDDVEAALTRRTIPADKQPTPGKGRGRKATSALSPNSLIKLHSTLSQALTWAQRRDLVTRNVATLAELPTGAITQRTGKSLSIQQARQLLAAAAGTQLEAMWTLMLYLGLRPGEAAGLSWNDIDFTNGTTHIWRARTTNTDGSVTIGNTKTPGSIRTLEAPEAVLDALEHHRQRQDAHADALGTAWSNPDNLVFTSPSGRPADPKAVRNEFDRLIAAAGIQGRWTPNLLRHTAASLMADAGLPIEHVADQLGHKDLRMLQQHYRHRIKPTIGGAHILDSVLGANPPSPDG
jgi:integrase